MKSIVCILTHRVAFKIPGASPWCNPLVQLSVSSKGAIFGVKAGVGVFFQILNVLAQNFAQFSQQCRGHYPEEYFVRDSKFGILGIHEKVVAAFFHWLRYKGQASTSKDVRKVSTLLSYWQATKAGLKHNCDSAFIFPSVMQQSPKKVQGWEALLNDAIDSLLCQCEIPALWGFFILSSLFLPCVESQMHPGSFAEAAFGFLGKARHDNNASDVIFA